MAYRYLKTYLHLFIIQCTTFSGDLNSRTDTLNDFELFENNVDILEEYENAFDTFGLQRYSYDNYAVKSLKSGKSPGPFGILPKMFISIFEHILPILNKLFNRVFAHGQFPDLWSKSITITIHKKVTQIWQIIIEVFHCSIFWARSILTFYTED